MEKRKARILFIAAFLFLGSVFCINPLKAQAAQKKIIYNNRVIGNIGSDNMITYVPIKGDNAGALEYLLNNDKNKKVVLPKGSVIHVNQVVDIGSNTMLNATGATIIQTDPERGLLKHGVDGTYYNAIKNVTIVGGTWKNASNSKAHTFVRFAHAQNVKLKNMTIVSNYLSHGIELIACKDVKVYNCTVKAENNGTKIPTSVEDGIQIDVATPITAPGVYKETGYQKKYVNGQTCRNIRIEKCDVYGARGICANYSPKESKFHNKYHRNVTIYNCKITGTSAQGIALYNTIDCLIQGNTVRNMSTQSGLAYPSGIHLQLFGSSSGGTNKILYNTVYGMKQGIYIDSVKSKAYYGKTTVTGNKVFVRNGRSINLRRCRYLIQKKNKISKW